MPFPTVMKIRPWHSSAHISHKIYNFYLDSDTATVYYKGMEDKGRSWTIEELAEQAESSVRTIRYYISEGLLPKPEGRGRSTIYNAEHLQRLRLIRGLIAQRVPLNEIREQISTLSSNDLEDLLADTRNRQAEEHSARTSSPKEYLSALLARAREERQSPRIQQRTMAEPLSLASPSPSLQLHEIPVSYKDLWTRYELAPGVELHVARSAEKRERALVKALFEAVSKEGQNT